VEYDGPRDVASMFTDDRFRFRRSLKVGQARIMRMRPMIPTGWSLRFSAEFDESIIERSQLVTAMQEAGSLVGLGDWRPKFGRFEVEICK
jgi:hypothetical protein